MIALIPNQRYFFLFADGTTWLYANKNLKSFETSIPFIKCDTADMSGFLNFVFLLSKLLGNRAVLQVFGSFDKFSQSFQVMSSYDKKTYSVVVSIILSRFNHLPW